MLYDLLVYGNIERQSYRDRKEVSGYQRLGMRGGVNYKGLGGNVLGAGIISLWQ